MRLIGAVMNQRRKGAEGGRPRISSRAMVISVAAFLAVGVFAASVTIAYQMGLESGRGQSITIIRADDGPVKVRPKDPGGMSVPFRDKVIYRQMAKDAGKSQPERLLPPAEKPIENLLNAVDPSASSGGKPPVAGATSAPEKVAPMAAPPPIEAVPAAQGDSAANADGVPMPRPRPMQKADAGGVDAAPTSAPSHQTQGGYVAQLGAARSMEAIRFTWSRIHKHNPELFRGLQPDYQTHNAGGSHGTWYRLRVGPFAQVADARAFCGRAKAHKVACIVVSR